NIDPDQEVDSDVLADALNGLIYDNEMFDGSDLDIEALSSALFGEFEEKPVYRQLDPEEIPDWPGIIAAHYSDGEVDASDIDDLSVDCSIEAFEANLDFNNLDNFFNIWASSLPLCAMAEVGP
ncbi:MAG: hypothetical protein ACE5RJ_02295, partial [Nitrosopumilaceae archaeon]